LEGMLLHDERDVRLDERDVRLLWTRLEGMFLHNGYASIVDAFGRNVPSCCRCVWKEYSFMMCVCRLKGMFLYDDRDMRLL
jgi:hypothetical protein